MSLRVLWLTALVACSGGDDGTMPQSCDQPTSELAQEIHAPITLTAACSPYHASTPIAVYAEVDIEPGVTIELADGTSFATGTNDTGMGSIVARGTAAKPIIFASDHGGAPVGSWDFVDIEGRGASELHYVQILGAGGAHSNNNTAALELGGDVPVVIDQVSVLDSAQLGVRVIGPIAAGSSGLHVDGAAAEPIQIQSSQLGTLPTATFGATNASPYILVDLDDVAASATWVSQPIPFHLPSPLLVYQAPDDSSVVLTIQPNTFLFDAKASFSIGGEISTHQGHANLVAANVTLDAFDPAAGWAGLWFIGRYDASSVVGGTVAHGSGPGLDDTADQLDYIPTVYIEKDATANAYPTLTHLTVRDTVVPPNDGGAPKVGTCIGTSAPMVTPPPDYAAAALGNTFANCGMSTAYWYDLN